MVVTATGLVYATSLDGSVYDYDADNGDILWKKAVGRANPQGIPAMYEANGRQYLVICSTGRLMDESLSEEDIPKGYVVYADRKSTRLNSSHVKISYAVFCLKKKRKN